MRLLHMTEFLLYLLAKISLPTVLLIYCKQVIEESQTAAAAVIVTAAEDAALNDDAIMAAAGNVKEEAITDHERDDSNEGGQTGE